MITKSDADMLRRTAADVLKHEVEIDKLIRDAVMYGRQEVRVNVALESVVDALVVRYSSGGWAVTKGRMRDNWYVIIRIAPDEKPSDKCVACHHERAGHAPAGCVRVNYNPSTHDGDPCRCGGFKS